MANVVEVLEAHRNFGVPGEGMKAISLDELSGKRRPIALAAPSYMMTVKMRIWEWLKYQSQKIK